VSYCSHILIPRNLILKFLLRGVKPIFRMYLASRGSSVSTVPDYGQDDQADEVRSPAEEIDFPCSQCVQTISGPHSASFTMGIGRLFPSGKARPGLDADHSPHLVPSLKRVGAITPLSQANSWRVIVQL
jgi:hypothetical protein